MTTPMFFHGCSTCRFLGHSAAGNPYAAADLYACVDPDGTPKTLLARFSSGGPNYTSAPVDIVEQWDVEGHVPANVQLVTALYLARRNLDVLGGIAQVEQVQTFIVDHCPEVLGYSTTRVPALAEAMTRWLRGEPAGDDAVRLVKLATKYGYRHPSKQAQPTAPKPVRVVARDWWRFSDAQIKVMAAEARAIVEDDAVTTNAVAGDPWERAVRSVLAIAKGIVDVTKP
mgnify:CR=1 FL=1